jgi:ribonuclease PH
MVRDKNRLPDETRPLTLTTHFTTHAEGSVLIETGNTRIICTASIEEEVPPFLKGKKRGWLSAEYNMLPRSTTTRTLRERGKIGGRTLEIQRLIGRSLRSSLDLENLGERTIWIDCDVIQADGGTRTASITGGYVAMALALRKIQRENDCFPSSPINRQIAAISLGIVDDQILLDLDYNEDKTAEVDMNIVMTSEKEIIEIQGTAERTPFSRERLNTILDIAEKGLDSLFAKQLSALKIKNISDR